MVFYSARCGSRGCQGNRCRRQSLGGRAAQRLGGVAQLGERLLCKQEVIGSIPFTSTIAQCASRIVASAAAVAQQPRERLVQKRAPAACAARSGEATVCLRAFELGARSLIFDRVKREYLGSGVAVVRRCELSRRMAGRTGHHPRMAACCSSARRASSCETCCYAGLVPASDGFSDQALR